MLLSQTLEVKLPENLESFDLHLKKVLSFSLFSKQRNKKTNALNYLLRWTFYSRMLCPCCAAFKQPLGRHCIDP